MTISIALPDIIIYGALDDDTRAYQVENLVKRGITDKASYLSEAIMLRLLFLSILLVSFDHTRIYIILTLIPLMM